MESFSASCSVNHLTDDLPDGGVLWELAAIAIKVKNASIKFFFIII
jgi:hypothetical protein